MRATKLLGQLTAYYLIIGVIVLVAVKMWPELARLFADRRGRSN